MASFGVPWVDLSLEKRDGVRDNGFLRCAFAQLEMALPVYEMGGVGVGAKRFCTV